MRLGPLSATLILACGLGRAPALGQATYHWINPAGGSFAQGSNWDLGQPPSTFDTAVFGLDAEYTVSVGASAGIRALSVEQGVVSLEMGTSQLGVDTIDVGNGAAPSATLHLLSGTLNSNLLSLTVHVGAVAGTTGSFIVDAGARVSGAITSAYLGGAGTAYVLLRGLWTDNQSSGTMNLYPGSTVHIEPTGWLIMEDFFDYGGRVEVDGGQIGVSHGGGDGDLEASNGARLHFTDAFGHGQGLLALRSGATLNSGNGPTTVNGDVIIDGPGSGYSGGYFNGSPTSLRVTNGGTLHPLSVNVSNTSVYVDATSTISVYADFVLSGLLHAEQGAVLTLGSIRLHDPCTLEFALDGANLPAAPLITGNHVPMLTGTVRPIFSHANNLRVGDQVELIRENPGSYFSTFSNLDYVPLGGGRQLQLVYAGPSVFLRVVAGGSPCWTTDFDGDGDYGTDADIEAFFACLGGSCCATCGSPDFDGDGQPGTDADIEAFFRVLAGGSC